MSSLTWQNAHRLPGNRFQSTRRSLRVLQYKTSPDRRVAPG